MYGQTVFNTILIEPGIIRSDFRMTDDVMTDYVISYDIITKIFKFPHRFLKRG